MVNAAFLFCLAKFVDAQCPDTIDGDYTCQQQKDWGKCSEDWMIGSCCQTCFGCAEGCGAKIPPRPSCADQSVEPEGSPGKLAAALFEQLKGLWKGQSTTLSGQTGGKDFDDLATLVGKTPAVKGFDMQNYSPHNPWHDDWSSWDDGTVASAIDWHASTGGKGIVQFQWHWFSPPGGNLGTSTFMSENTDFDTAKSVVAGTDENVALVRDLNAIALQLKRLRDAGVPVLWRPLHEARGNDYGAWFWWGRAGASVTLQILDIMRDVFLNQHELDNLIWVWSEPNNEWYPGNDKIDILGYDSYPGAYDYTCQEGIWNQYLETTACKKMLALSEVGPISDVDHCHSQGIRWLYFMGWGSLTGDQNTAEHLHSVFDSSHVKSLEDLSSELTV
jgi:mannan endo-1,4-beta-mannosidase